MHARLPVPFSWILCRHPLAGRDHSQRDPKTLRDRADATEVRKRLIGGSWLMGTEDTAPSPFAQAECRKVSDAFSVRADPALRISAAREA